MKLTLSTTGFDTTIKNLEDAGVILPQKFNDLFKREAVELAKRAREILYERSMNGIPPHPSRKNPGKYWTGRLSSAIKSSFDSESNEKINVSVGVDEKIAEYAEWVEFGHFTGLGKKYGTWWEGYHYMEAAYIEAENNFKNKFGAKMKLELDNFRRTANKRTTHGTDRYKGTGRFVRGFAGRG